jgi:hypothetical protein
VSPVVNENCEGFHEEGENYLFATTESIAYDTWRNQKSLGGTPGLV